MGYCRNHVAVDFRFFFTFWHSCIQFKKYLFKEYLPSSKRFVLEKTFEAIIFRQQICQVLVVIVHLMIRL